MASRPTTTTSPRMQRFLRVLSLLCLVGGPFGIAVALARDPVRWQLVGRGLAVLALGAGLLRHIRPSGE